MATEAEIELAQLLVRSALIDAQLSFVDLPAAEIAAHCNGCGSAQYKMDLVPDTIYGLSITPACHIHDWDYHVGTTIADKDSADRRFLNNMLRLIEARGGLYQLIVPLARRRALKYYEAVHSFGGPSFWAGKNLFS